VRFSLGSMIGRFRIDAYVLAILLTVGAAALVPARGEAAAGLDKLVTSATTLVFFIYGARLPTGEALNSMRNWRLHLAVTTVTFGLFPIMALGCALLVPGVVDRSLYIGVVFLCALPSTVQSSITLTSVARGNEAAAICSASLSNLIGVVLTPVLLAALLAADRDGFSLESAGDVVLRLLLPFLAGQAAQPWIGGWLRRRRQHLARLDRGVIVLVVYAAFSKGVVTGIWQRLTPGRLGLLVVVVAVLLVASLTGAGLLSRGFGFARGDHIAVLFCGSQKSLASGLPMAMVLFDGGNVSLTVLPLMLYHQLQLMVCGWLAQRFAVRTPGTAPTAPAPATA
jgi:sodium/bile acid cotransporter 7